jgi:hypothetical protein
MKLKRFVKFRMNVHMMLYVAILFFVLSPGVLLSLPKGGSVMQKAAVHAVVFAAVWHFTHKMVWRYTHYM